MKASVQNYSGHNRPLRSGRDFEPDQTLVDQFHEINQGGQSQRVRPLADPMTGSACPHWTFPCARREDAPWPARQSSRHDANFETAVLAGGVQRPSQEGIAPRPAATPTPIPPLERP